MRRRSLQDDPLTDLSARKPFQPTPWRPASTKLTEWMRQRVEFLAQALDLFHAPGSSSRGMDGVGESSRHFH